EPGGVEGKRSNGGVTRGISRAGRGLAPSPCIGTQNAHDTAPAEHGGPAWESTTPHDSTRRRHDIADTARHRASRRDIAQHGTTPQSTARRRRARRDTARPARRQSQASTWPCWAARDGQSTGRVVRYPRRRRTSAAAVVWELPSCCLAVNTAERRAAVKGNRL